MAAANKLTWLKDNCVSLSIEINEHKSIYMTVAEFFADDAEKGMDRFGDDDLDPNVRAVCIEKNALCVLQVYPDTPVGFLLFVHHDVEAVIAEAFAWVRRTRGIE